MKNPIKRIILLVLVCIIASLCFVYTASAQSTLVTAEASATQPHVGDTLTINVKIQNVQNLYGVDVTFNWNPTVLKFISVTPQLGVESHSNGVLHESSSYPVQVDDNTASQEDGQYHLLATSTGASTPAFSGSGTIVTLTFNVTSTGQAGLALSDVELSIQNSDGSMNLVNPQTQADTVNAVQTAIPEFPAVNVAIAVVVIVAATAVLVLTTKRRKNKA
jgi:hypothetical protein